MQGEDVAILLRFALLALAAAFFSMLFEPFFSALLLGVGVDTAKLAPPLIAWIRNVSAMGWFVPVACLTFGTTFGVWAHHLVRRADSKRAPPRKAAYDLGLQMDSMRDRMMRAHKRFADRQDNIPQVTKLFTEYTALQVSIHKMGITAPWLYWDVPSEDPRPFLQTNVGYLAAVAPLLKAGHVKEAKMLAAKYVGDFKAADHTSLSKPAATQP